MTDVQSQPASTIGPDAMRARYQTVQAELEKSLFQQPLVLRSSESGGEALGEIHATLDYAFQDVVKSLRDAASWCAVLILHINVKQCQTRALDTDSSLMVRMGSKSSQDAASAWPMEFVLPPAEVTSGYFRMLLSAATGPLGSSNYRLAFEAIPQGGNSTFIRVSYAYSYGWAGKLAAQAYLGTAGKDKVGFSRTPATADAASVPIGGIRGALERNAMRYYLAMLAVLESRSLQGQSQTEHALNYWFDATEQYPLQLHEMDKATYLNMKRVETEPPIRR